jgi:serine/threonine protein kinase
MFRDFARLSGLVNDEQLEAALWALREDGGTVKTTTDAVEDDVLANKLVDMDVLTQYQATQLLAGRTKFNVGAYIVTDFIGQGGMGQVFKAEHSVMGRECAVKVLPREKCTPEAIAHFRREIRTQAKLDHPHLVRAYDAGEEGKVHFLVTEYVPGTDLRKLVRSEKRLSMQQAASIIMQASEGLAYAHDHGLIHRDVKPGNILVTPDGIAKLSDLGLAGYLDEREHDPRKGKIVGTADYLAPEQILNPHDTLPVSDIYSLGCTLYYAVTAKVPYPGGSPSSKAKRHLEETPWHPRQFHEEVSDEFVDIIADMMDKDPSKRIQTASEVVARLKPWATDSQPIHSKQMTRSPWMSPPLPTGSIEEDMGAAMQDTGSATYDPAEFSGSGTDNSGSQISQRTSAFASGSQETNRISETKPPLPPLLSLENPEDPQLSKTACVVIALSVAIPVALALGVMIGFGLSALLK